MLRTAQAFARKTGKDSDSIIEDMQSGDYEHLIQVFDREFGDFVILYR